MRIENQIDTEVELSINIEECEPYCGNKNNSGSTTLTIPIQRSINLDPILLHYDSNGIIRPVN
jgi:hypothetical protein